MKIWIVYDSKYGNNKQIAGALATRFSDEGHDVQVHYAKTVKPGDALDTDVLVFGGPIHLGQITLTIKGWVVKFAKVLRSSGKSLKKVAAWGTHLEDKPETPPKVAWAANALNWKALMDDINAEKRMPAVQSFVIKPVDGKDTLVANWQDGVAELASRIKSL